MLYTKYVIGTQRQKQVKWEYKKATDRVTSTLTTLYGFLLSNYVYLTVSIAFEQYFIVLVKLRSEGFN